MSGSRADEERRSIMRLTTLNVVVALLLGSSGAVAAAEGERTFLLCAGVSQSDRADAFSFTVTLDVPNATVLSIGSGEGAVTEAFTDTEIVGRQDVGGGVTNRLTIDRAARTFRLVIHRSQAPTEADDAFEGTCSPTSRAF
jgi:hypothetical protein